MDNFWISFCGELDEGYKPDFRISKNKPDFYEGYCYTYVYNSDFVENLKLENFRYRKALEFYANPDNWKKSNVDNASKIHGDDVEHIVGMLLHRGGRRAREALKENE